VTVSVTSSLTAPVYFFWYLDGAFAGMTGSGSKVFILPQGDQSVVDVLDSADPDFDYIANAPTQYPARRTLVFIRSADAATARYRIDQQAGGGAWEIIGFVAQETGRWQYTFVTGRLDDLTLYAWRVVPLDSAGNAGTAVTIAQELIVRSPDAPNFTATLQVSTRVAFASA